MNNGVFMEAKKSLTLQDIAIIIDILNVASSRNAFRVEEYATVGTIFQKLSSLIQTSDSTQPDVNSTSEETKND